MRQTVALAGWHLGSLHAYEQALVWVLAFGPFVVLGVVVHLMRRRDLAAEHETADGLGVTAGPLQDAGQGGAGSAPRAGEPGPADLTLAHQRQDQDPPDE